LVVGMQGDQPKRFNGASKNGVRLHYSLFASRVNSEA